ncbi:MAG: alkaline phosphatase family protein [Ignavibacteriales bacterium]
MYLLDKPVDTVVIVIMENRSFDHMLGRLSYDKIRSANVVIELIGSERDDDTRSGNNGVLFGIVNFY